MYVCMYVYIYMCGGALGRKKRNTFLLAQFYRKKRPKMFCENSRTIFWGLLGASQKHLLLQSQVIVWKKHSEIAEIRPFEAQTTENRSFSWNVEHVDCVLGGFLKKVLLSAAMLNMLIMLNVLRTYRPFEVHPQKNNIQHYSWKKRILRKMCFFQL